MNVTDLAVQLEAARQMEVAAGGVTFKVRLPSDHALKVAYQGSRDARGVPVEATAMRQVLDGAVVGWEGLKASHLLESAGDEPVPFSAQARFLLLETREDLADELTIAISVRMRARRDELEAARKNS